MKPVFPSTSPKDVREVLKAKFHEELKPKMKDANWSHFFNNGIVEIVIDTALSTVFNPEIVDLEKAYEHQKKALWRIREKAL